VDEIGRACSTNWGKWLAYRILVGKPGGKKPLRRPKCMWVNNIKMDLMEREDGMIWIGLIGSG
jgi:hypothetical protein